MVIKKICKTFEVPVPYIYKEYDMPIGTTVHDEESNDIIIILPKKGVVGPKLLKALELHELAHACELMHGNGKHDRHFYETMYILGMYIEWLPEWLMFDEYTYRRQAITLLDMRIIGMEMVPFSNPPERKAVLEMAAEGEDMSYALAMLHENGERLPKWATENPRFKAAHRDVRRMLDAYCRVRDAFEAVKKKGGWRP